MLRLKQISLFFTCLLVMVFTAQAQETFTIGADLSRLPELLDDGVRFYDGSVERNVYDILQDHSVNTIRLRLWHTPDEPWSGLDSTLAHAIRVKEMGFDLLLDFHYSDWWADPAHQTPPDVWQGLSIGELEDSVRTYTENVIRRFNEAGALPNIVQIGNEITNGFLWDYGAVTGEFNTVVQWTQFTDLLKAGIEGIGTGAGGENVPLILIHSHDGGNMALSQYFFDKLDDYEVEFDIIGLSYYPWWHGDLEDLQSNLNNLATRYGKPIQVVETAYPFTFGWADNTNNIVWEDAEILDAYPASETGQAAYMAALVRVIQGIPNGLGMGVFWWEPCWIIAPTVGSSWENLCWFDFDNHSLPVLDSLVTVLDVDEWEQDYSLLPVENRVTVYPNPSNGSFNFYLPDIVETIRSLSLYSIDGKKVGSVSYRYSNGYYKGTISSQDYPSGMYFLFITDTSGKTYQNKVILLK